MAVTDDQTVLLPSYLLYGEGPDARQPERLHIETISSRSRVHDWEIKPHRHEVLFQFLYIAQGHVEARLDTDALDWAAPVLVSVPAGTAHGFRFAPGTEGQVVTVRQSHLQALLGADPALVALFDGPRHHRPDRAAVRDLASATRELAAEHAATRPFRAMALDAALVRLALAAVRALPPAGETSGSGAAGDSRAAGHVTRYRALLEARFRLQPRVGDLADELGITPTQLNRVCRAVTGHNALALLHARLQLEAERGLAYTTLSVKRIALDLGFADAGYFSRFFARRTGLTPSGWRSRARS